ncbi:MAG TPA: SpoIID/LytB domain-containing protein [Candidatus Limnocylindrales bacterium]|nr:SpoIID/LytB domain-containing protein [Candidatus Limnocylindrales bacterium]
MGWPTSATTLGTTVTFYGRGWGHGVGLNQYGAKGRALGGQTAEQILAAYYKGAKTTTVSPTRNVRVLVLAGYRAVKSAPLVIHGRATEWTIDGVAKRFPAGGVLKLYRTTATVDGVATTTWRLRVYAADGATLLHSAVVSGSVVVRPTSGSTRLQLDSKPSSFDTYRGLLKVKLGASTATVVNHLALDLYLRGVVPVEMDPGWPTEALRAQTAAARSYAVRRLHPGEGSFDVYDDTRSQVYRGVEAEKSSTNKIIAAHPGQVIAVNGTIVNAFFFATGGGSTENNEYVFVSSTGAVGTAVAYLRGIPDRRPDGTAWDAGSPRWSWSTSTLTRAQLTAMFKGDSRTNVGDLTKLGLTKRGVSGRLYKVTLYGSAGSKTVSADVFRAIYNARRPAGTLPLLSNLFDAKRLAGS